VIVSVNGTGAENAADDRRQRHPHRLVVPVSPCLGELAAPARAWSDVRSREERELCRSNGVLSAPAQLCQASWDAAAADR
jgi:hypothetical protein